MLELVVIADDITGAADTGAQFLAAAAPVVLVDHRRLASGRAVAGARVLSVFTSSRALTAGEARRTVLAAAGRIRSLGPRQVYKKIDSCLRGRIGVELEAVMEAVGAPASFIAPAFPAQGRGTLGGIHRLHGVPVAETEIGRDPVAPVTESNLCRWIAGQAAAAVAHIAIETLEAGIDAAAAEVERRLAGGARHVTFDATSPRHLDAIADLARERFPQVLLCGSAGLAQSLAGRMMPPVAAQPGQPLPGLHPGGGILFVCGSASERLRRQVGELAVRSPVTALALEPGALTAAAPALAGELDRAVAALAAGDLALRIATPAAGAPAADPRLLLAAFARFAGALIARASPACLFVSGGDTALAVFEGMRVEAVRLQAELAGGIVGGILVGGPLSGRLVVTKAGSFGEPDALVGLYRRLRPPAGP
jgi:uncharacterized protein YgbK (DUF1537 family)